MAVVDELILGLGVKVDGSAFTKIAGFASVLATGVNQALEIANKIYGVFENIGREMEKVGTASLAMEQLSQRTGMSTDEIQAWTLAGVRMGGTAEELTADLDNMAASARMMGLSVPQFIEKISGQLKGMDLVQAQVFGKSLGLSNSSIRVMQAGQVNFKKLVDDLMKSGMRIPPKTIRAAAEFERQLKTMGLLWEQLKVEILGPLTGKLAEMLRRMLDWLRTSDDAKRTIQRLGEKLLWLTEKVVGLIYWFVKLCDGNVALGAAIVILTALMYKLAASLVASSVGALFSLPGLFVALGAAAVFLGYRLGELWDELHREIGKTAAPKSDLNKQMEAEWKKTKISGGHLPGEGERNWLQKLFGNYDNNPDDSKAFAVFAVNFRQTHATDQSLRTQTLPTTTTRTSTVTDNRRTEINVHGVTDPRQAAGIVMQKVQTLDLTAPGNFAPAAQ